MHKDIEQRLGRPVFTHELANDEVQEQIHNAYKDDFISMCPTTNKTMMKLYKCNKYPNKIFRRLRPNEHIKETDFRSARSNPLDSGWLTFEGVNLKYNPKADDWALLWCYREVKPKYAKVNIEDSIFNGKIFKVLHKHSVCAFVADSEGRKYFFFNRSLTFYTNKKGNKYAN